uniref:Protein kinase-like domain, concanavalin A-like lectin/glucanase domain protein n=1 Tax=Tanacetum cinerariifolium TaxID=118510 RepID=A0A6L2MCZ3_TANCI|nr:protein kinase-like domain, concanavalin A-like lectin/glucanase domain protein [Tanacetum cinerariifolium]
MATDNFSDNCKIGRGEFGRLYKAELKCFDREYLSYVEDKTFGSEHPKRHYIVTIERIDDDEEDMFLNKIDILRSCKHQNIHILLGFCDEGPHMLLVYEYVQFTHLSKYLEVGIHTWENGLKICLDVARGLNYLHTKYGGSKDDEPMAPLARQWFDKGIIKDKIASAIKEENWENRLFLNKGPNENSLDVFLKVARQCFAETHNQRPTMQVVITELEKALSFQENHKDPLRMSFEDIKFATQDFSRENDIGGGGFGRVYKGTLPHVHGNGNYTIVAKRLDTSLGQGDQQFYSELQILYEYKHENFIDLLGYSNDARERIIVYEHASRGSLDNYLNDVDLTWRKRLQICIDFATGLAFLHGGGQERNVVIHRDIKTANILLFDDWKAKVADFGLSLTILFEILFGRSTYAIYKQKKRYLHSLVKDYYEEGKQDELVFEAIKEQIVPKSLSIFQKIAYQCLHDDREKRPTSKEVLAHLKMALDVQDGKES